LVSEIFELVKTTFNVVGATGKKISGNAVLSYRRNKITPIYFWRPKCRRYHRQQFIALVQVTTFTQLNTQKARLEKAKVDRLSAQSHWHIFKMARHENLHKIFGHDAGHLDITAIYA